MNVTDGSDSAPEKFGAFKAGLSPMNRAAAKSVGED